MPIYKSYETLMEGVDNREDCTVGTEGIWKISCLPLNFAVNLKLLKK
jgi:hypothetical protein